LEERDALLQSATPFDKPHETRILPILHPEPTFEDVLQYAFSANAEIEQVYFEWRVAFERVAQAVSLDDPRFSFAYLFSKEKFQAWDRVTLGGAQMIPAPGKRELAGQIALQEAIAARRRFEDAKFSLQANVVTEWNELLFMDRSITIGEANVELLREFLDTTLQLVAVGKAPQSAAIKADLEAQNEHNELQRRIAERRVALSRLNALLSRSPNTPVAPKIESSTKRALNLTDDEILELIAERNPELKALAAEVRGREDALKLARKAYVPDLEVSLSLIGTMEQMLMGMINMPLRVTRIEAGIAEAQAGIRAAQAALRERGNDLGSRAALQLYLARDSERQSALLHNILIPRAREVIDGTQGEYLTGGASFLDLLDAQRSLLALELTLARVDAIQASAVAALEALAALDFGGILKVASDE
jgi:outer membrane protein TolC